MRIINKKYLLAILLVGIIITGGIIFIPKENVKLDNVILKQEVNNKTFAMYTETDNGYEEYEGNKFPDMYVLNIEKSKCIDNNGNELENVLSYENDKVTITSGNTTYCYLYFDKSLGLEIKEKKPNKLSTDKIRGAMYRFQGQQDENVNNYICFGTSDKNKCTNDTNHYMYRIIGIEAETGRVKVIKKEALDNAINCGTDLWAQSFSLIDYNWFKRINAEEFLDNDKYIPTEWQDKISNNNWLYGNMPNNDVSIGARQIGEILYKIESGYKETGWYLKSENGEISSYLQNDIYPEGATIYYQVINSEWTDYTPAKISLMYLHDYYYSVSDTAICQSDEGKYEECKKGWMNLSNNDTNAPVDSEWTMTSEGFTPWQGTFYPFHIQNNGQTMAGYDIRFELSVRPVFYINASEELLDGEGTIDNPFIIK